MRDNGTFFDMVRDNFWMLVALMYSSEQPQTPMISESANMTDLDYLFSNQSDYANNIDIDIYDSNVHLHSDDFDDNLYHTHNSDSHHDGYDDYGFDQWTSEMDEFSDLDFLA